MLKSLPEPVFLAGDLVTWTHVRQNGQRIHLSVRQGRVTSAGDGIVAVRYRGRELVLPSSKLRKKGEVTELTEFTLGLLEET